MRILDLLFFWRKKAPKGDSSGELSDTSVLSDSSLGGAVSSTSPSAHENILPQEHTQKNHTTPTMPPSAHLGGVHTRKSEIITPSYSGSPEVGVQDATPESFPAYSGFPEQTDAGVETIEDASYAGFPEASYEGFPVASYDGFPEIGDIDTAYSSFPSYDGFPEVGTPDAGYGGFPSYEGFPEVAEDGTVGADDPTYDGFPEIGTPDTGYGGFPSYSSFPSYDGFPEVGTVDTAYGGFPSYSGFPDIADTETTYTGFPVSSYEGFPTGSSYTLDTMQPQDTSPERAVVVTDLGTQPKPEQEKGWGGVGAVTPPDPASIATTVDMHNHTDPLTIKKAGNKPPTTHL